jgi:hypothetical protein
MARHRFDDLGIAPLIQDLEFGRLIAVKVFDNNALIADIDAIRPSVCDRAHPDNSTHPTGIADPRANYSDRIGASLAHGGCSSCR